MNGDTGKSAKASRFNKAQKEALLKYMEDHNSFASGKLLGIDGKNKGKAMWDELTHILNTLGPAQKDSGQWQTVWRDLKFKVSKKLSESRRILKATGGKKPGVQTPDLDPSDLRLADVIGHQYILGVSGVPESMPETDEQFERMEREDESVYLHQPVIIDDNPIEFQNVAVFQQSERGLSMETVDTMETVYNGDDDEESAIVVGSGGPTETPSRKRVASTPSNSNINHKKFKKPSRVRIGAQMQDARHSFQDIAARQAEAMHMMAEAAAQQAKAAISQAQSAAEMSKAALLQAENETRKLAVMERLTTVIEKLVSEKINIF